MKKSTPTMKTILGAKHNLKDKFVEDHKDLKELIQLLKSSGYKIVLTQGVYDMYHVGHQRYLSDASEFGDILIVGIDSDKLTRKMKGPNRPFDNFLDRIELLAGLGFVNILTGRDVGEHKYDLIKLVKPDVLVMSKTTRSFNNKDIKALQGFYGEIQHLKARAATSTTAKLRRLMDSGAKELAEKLQNIVTGHLNEDEKS